jgi:sugar lactone lactonase YvrE
MLPAPLRLGALVALAAIGLSGMVASPARAFQDDEEATIAGHANVRVLKISTIAGTGVAGFNKDGILLRKAQLYWPQDTFVDAAGNLYILDFNNHRVRLARGLKGKIHLKGKISTVIGSGLLGDGTSGPATGINLNHPSSICVDAAGRLVLSAWHNWKIKRVNADGNVETIAGTGQGFSGDGALATKAQLDLPSSAEFDAEGNLYISDQGNRRIRKVDPSGIITTFAGTGEPGYNGDYLPADQAQLNSPRGSDALPSFKIALRGNNLYLADTLNHRVRVIDLIGGIISTLAGTGTPGYSGDNGPAGEATLNFPTDVAVGPDGSVYICDSRNHVIRKVTPQGVISTVAGTGVPGFGGDGKDARKARLNTPSGIFVDRDGTLYVADTLNNRIRMVK